MALLGVIDRNTELDPKLISGLEEQARNTVFGILRLNADQRHSVR